MHSFKPKIVIWLPKLIKAYLGYEIVEIFLLTIFKNLNLTVFSMVLGDFKLKF